MARGIWYGVAAYSLWGLLPIYFKLFVGVSPAEVLAQRIVWSFVTLALVMTLMRGQPAPWRVSRRVWAMYSLAALLIGVNWFVYLWSVAHEFIVEASLGYFITPLVNVLLGVAVLGERFRRGQWIAVALAAIGVVYLTIVHGSLPWISLTLAISFGCYGLIKKQVPLGAMHGLTLETGMLLPPAFAYAIAVQMTGDAAFLHRGVLMDVLLVSAGILTIGPLALFATSVQLVPLSIIGLLQYLAPTLQFLLAVLVYGEPFSGAQVVGFTIVWAALVVFTVEGLLATRQSRGLKPVRYERTAGTVRM
jgi:chloramphenicol-sensitive protein RarD